MSHFDSNIAMVTRGHQGSIFQFYQGLFSFFTNIIEIWFDLFRKRKKSVDKNFDIARLRFISSWPVISLLHSVLLISV